MTNKLCISFDRTLGDSQVWVKCAVISRCLLRKFQWYFLKIIFKVMLTSTTFVHIVK